MSSKTWEDAVEVIILAAAFYFVVRGPNARAALDKPRGQGPCANGRFGASSVGSATAMMSTGARVKVSGCHALFTLLNQEALVSAAPRMKCLWVAYSS